MISNNNLSNDNTVITGHNEKLTQEHSENNVEKTPDERRPIIQPKKETRLMYRTKRFTRQNEKQVVKKNGKQQKGKQRILVEKQNTPNKIALEKALENRKKIKKKEKFVQMEDDIKTTYDEIAKKQQGVKKNVEQQRKKHERGKEHINTQLVKKLNDYKVEQAKKQQEVKKNVEPEKEFNELNLLKKNLINEFNRVKDKDRPIKKDGGGHNVVKTKEIKDREQLKKNEENKKNIYKIKERKVPKPSLNLIKPVGKNNACKKINQNEKQEVKKNVEQQKGKLRILVKKPSKVVKNTSNKIALENRKKMEYKKKEKFVQKPTKDDIENTYVEIVKKRKPRAEQQRKKLECVKKITNNGLLKNMNDSVKVAQEKRKKEAEKNVEQKKELNELRSPRKSVIVRNLINEFNLAAKNNNLNTQNSGKIQSNSEDIADSDDEGVNIPEKNTEFKFDKKYFASNDIKFDKKNEKPKNETEDMKNLKDKSKDKGKE